MGENKYHVACIQCACRRMFLIVPNVTAESKWRSRSTISQIVALGLLSYWIRKERETAIKH